LFKTLRSFWTQHLIQFCCTRSTKSRVV
jgi:hypothetical protein